MRKTTSILLTIIFLFNIGGYYLYFSILQFSIKEKIESQIKSGLQEKDLSMVVVPVNKTSDLIWLEHEKEFRYRGEMFDVVFSEVKGQNKIYYCINDRKEQQLIEKYQKSHSSKKDAEKKSRNAMNDRFLTHRPFHVNHSYSIDIQYARINMPFASTLIKIPSPPPKEV